MNSTVKTALLNVDNGKYYEKIDHMDRVIFTQDITRAKFYTSQKQIDRNLAELERMSNQKLNPVEIEIEFKVKGEQR